MDVRAEVEAGGQDPFLDYSTLEKRSTACEREIRINHGRTRHECSSSRRGHYGRAGWIGEVDGRGRRIEYAVDMSRFDESRTLDHLAKAGRFDADFASAIADAIAASHAAATPPTAAPISSIPP